MRPNPVHSGFRGECLPHTWELFRFAQRVVDEGDHSWATPLSLPFVPCLFHLSLVSPTCLPCLSHLSLVSYLSPTCSLSLPLVPCLSHLSLVSHLSRPRRDNGYCRCSVADSQRSGLLLLVSESTSDFEVCTAGWWGEEGARRVCPVSPGVTGPADLVYRGSQHPGQDRQFTNSRGCPGEC